MLTLLVELALEPQALLVRFDCADRLHHTVDPRFRLEVTELARRDGAFTRIVIGEARVPPDAGVEAFRELQARLIGARLLSGAVEMDEIRPRDHAHGRFAFTGVHVGRAIRFMCRLTRPGARYVLHVDDVVMWRLELALREKRQQAVVAAVT